MTKLGEAPIADWVTIPDLYQDPFPTFQRLREEGGVHWVPAVNRYLITSYQAVHETELDQETFSANETNSLLNRAMGHSMLRRDDPEHYVERRAWQPVLRPTVIKRTWLPLFERNADRYLQEFIEKGPGADLIWDFAAPFVSENLRAVIGLHNATQEDLQRWSQTMIDATGNYADDPEVWDRGRRSYDEVDAALDEMLVWHRQHPDTSLLSSLLALPDYQMPLDAIRANVKMTIGGGLNEPRDTIGVAAYALLSNPAQRDRVLQNPSMWDAVFDEAIRWIAPIGMYSRQVTRETELTGVRLPRGAKLGICLLSANRDEKVWRAPEKFDALRTDDGAHLAFGKGVHVCLGAWVARAEVAAVALPKLFARLPEMQLIPEKPAIERGWVFRGMAALPVSWDPTRSAVSSAPKIAIIGAGPSGCYTAQALHREAPDAEITVIDRLPSPYGLIRNGVAADHQGTKAVTVQFNRLFERDGVRFIGNVEVGTDITLDEIRRRHDAVVLATGLHTDVQLPIPGSDLPGNYGAGQITRLLNSNPDEVRPAPVLGKHVAVVGHGNVAMDIIRLLAKRESDLEGTDIDDEAHATLTAEVTTIHTVGRSMPQDAKFDPVMLREISDLHGVSHAVHFANESLGDDARSQLVDELRTRVPLAEPRLLIEWWFGYSPEAISGTTRATSLTMQSTTKTVTITVDSIISAIGFSAGPTQRLATVSEDARLNGRVQKGLYVAGWARRGPRGSIPSQRTDARELAATIARELSSSQLPGWRGLHASLPTATDYGGWLLIDAHERRTAAAGRLRRKISRIEELRLVAASAASITQNHRPEQSATSDTSGTIPLTVAFATESGSGELVADELARHLSDRFDVRMLDLGSADTNSLRPGELTLMVCSTYGDGEMPTTAREFRDRLAVANADLSGVRYAMFGLGDRSYTETYSRGSELLSDLLGQRGAVRVGEYGRHDAADREPAPVVARAWAEKTLRDVPVLTPDPVGHLLT